MREKISSFLIELCCVYTIISVVGAIVNMICGTETNNLNVLVMFATCIIATFVLYMHKLFDTWSPLTMIVVQYLTACVLCAIMLFIISLVVEPITPRGWYEFYRSFTIPYIFLAGFYYYRAYNEAKKQRDLLAEIQEKAEKSEQVEDKEE